MHSKLAIVLPIFGSACACDVVKMTISLRSCLHICAVTDVLRLKAGFEFISNKSGTNITDIVKLDYVYDSLLIESENNLTLPEWTKNKIVQFPGNSLFL